MFADEIALSPSEFRDAGCPSDTWGIINWARDRVPSVWQACPSARESMIESAAFRRWETCYSHTNAAHWISHARWICANLDDLLAEEIRREALT